MKRIIIFSFLVSILASCSNYKSKNRIYGKWYSEDISNVTKVILNFKGNDVLESEIFPLASGSSVYKENHPFLIVDEKTAIISETSQPEYKTKIRVTLEDNDKIRLDCQIQKSAEGKGIIDAPMLCTNHSFKRLE